MRTVALVMLVAALHVPRQGLAQAAPEPRAGNAADVEAFLASARAGTARYQDRDAAIADGYRAIGPDVPGMGQHWVNPTLLLGGVLDPFRPQVLNYITVNGRPVLAGVAYAIPTRGVAVAPVSPVGQAAWHFHAGTLDEESFLSDHHHAGAGPGEDTRVAVLHAWVWAANPAGTFEPDNWALPFVRLGFTPPPNAGAGAGRALALASVGEPFFLKMIREAGGPDSVALLHVADLLAAHAATVRAWAAQRRGRSLDGADAAWLASDWARLWDELRGSVTPDTWARLGRPLPGNERLK
jgi:hypothetical protein